MVESRWSSDGEGKCLDRVTMPSTDDCMGKYLVDLVARRAGFSIYGRGCGGHLKGVSYRSGLGAPPRGDAIQPVRSCGKGQWCL
jgi:hypothetical protein